MLGNRSSCYVVQAEELGNEVASMNGIHAAVPGKDDDKESKDARDGEEGKNLLRLFHGKAPENKKDAWKDKPDRAFSEAGKASSGISNDQMMAWEMIQNSKESASMSPAQMAAILSFRILLTYQVRSVTESAPQKAEGSLAARSVKPRME